MSALRYPRLWLVLGWLFVVAAVVVCLLPAGTPMIGVMNDKVEHALGYMALTLWFGSIYPRAKYWRVALGFLAMGVVIELVQGWMQWGRQCELADVYADAAGIAIGLLLAMTPIGRCMHWFESLFIAKRTS
jgi:VanZ family protein